jgi:hypothetical protein
MVIYPYGIRSSPLNPLSPRLVGQQHCITDLGDPQTALTIQVPGWTIPVREHLAEKPTAEVRQNGYLAVGGGKTRSIG